ncbi:hypothetical protein Tco_0444502 [Tanacetum coccineum]
MSDIGCCGLEHHHGKCWQFILHFIYVELLCHELRETGSKRQRGARDTLVDLIWMSCINFVEDTVMLDSEDSTDTQSLDYVPGPEEPEQAPPLPVYVPYVPDAGCTIPKEESEEVDDEDPKEDHADYPADGGDDGDDEDDSSDDDEYDDVDIEEDEEEEEHLAPADSTAVALPAVDHAPSAEETEPFETDESAATPPPHLAYQVTTRISIRDEPPTPFWSDTKVARLLAIPTPPPSPLSLWSSPLPQIPSLPLPLILSPLPVSSPPPASPTYPLGYRAAMIRMRAEAPSTSHSPQPHIILSHTRADTPSSGTPHSFPYTASDFITIFAATLC